jgi:hypothetical protein
VVSLSAADNHALRTRAWRGDRAERKKNVEIVLPG